MSEYNSDTMDLAAFDSEAGESDSWAGGLPPADEGHGLREMPGASPRPTGDHIGSPQQETSSVPADGTPADKRAAFRALITGEYRDQYAEATQRLINRRFRETEGLRAAAKRAAPLMDALAERYGIGADEPEALAAAVQSDVAELKPDDPILAALSERYDIDAGDKRALLAALQRENAARLSPGAEAALRSRRDRAAAAFADARCRSWLAEAEALQARCPDFDLAAMSRDRVFTTLLAAGLGVAAAWRAADAEGTARRAAAEARRDLAARIRAGMARPAEAGAASQAAFTVRADPGRFSDGQVRDVLAKLDRRERVSFG